MNYLTHKRVSRRHVLRGLGVSLALPFLDAMAVGSAAHPPLRLGFCYIPHGAIAKHWTPAGEGPNWTLSRNLEPLKHVKDQVVVLSNLNLKAAGGHDGTPRAFLSGSRAARTVDQIVAQRTRLETRLPSLELGTERANGGPGAWDSGVDSDISWETPATPLPSEVEPRAVFRRLFGDAAGRAPQGSILDAVRFEARSLQRQLGAGDRNRVADYLDSVRHLERRIEFTIPDDHAERTELMFELMALAYRADRTRVATFLMAREVSYRAFSHLGTRDGFHRLSHHQFDPFTLEHFIDVNTWHVAQVARFLETLKNTPDGDGCLLDHSLILYGSGMGLANSHQHTDLPVFIAGGANGQLKGNRHLKYPADTPLSNLLLSIADKAGVHLDRLGDSTGRLEGV